MTVKVQATKPGFFGGRMRAVGDVFEVDEKKAKAKWFKPVAEAEKKGEGKAEKKGEGPNTFSEVAKQDAATVAATGGNAPAGKK